MERKYSLGRKQRARVDREGKRMRRMAGRLHAAVSAVVDVEPHETSALVHSSASFFFVLSAYFVVLPLRDEGAISLGLSNLPELFVGSLILTLLTAPLSTLFFAIPTLSKSKALVLILRFFSVSLVVFFVLWHLSSSPTASSSFTSKAAPLSVSVGSKDFNFNQTSPAAYAPGWGDKSNGWFYVSVRIGLFLWVALLNLITISSTWARVIDVMDNESGSRLFGFIGAGATLGQLFGSLFATAMAWLGPWLLLFAALLMELAAQLSKGIRKDDTHLSEELTPIRVDDSNQQHEADVLATSVKVISPKSPASSVKPHLSAVLDGMWLVISSTYLLYVSLFLWLSAVVSSFFYFQKVTIIAETVTSSLGRRRLFAQINSIIAAFILAGQLTLTGRILTVAGVTIAICSAPVIAFLNMISIAVWPTWVAVAMCETIRKAVTYVVTRPARELLFTVLSQEEKYKAKICIDVVVQRLGDAAAAGMYKVLSSSLHGKTSTISLYALPVCVAWVVTAFHIGRRQEHLAKFQTVSRS